MTALVTIPFTSDIYRKLVCFLICFFFVRAPLVSTGVICLRGHTFAYNTQSTQKSCNISTIMSGAQTEISLYQLNKDYLHKTPSCTETNTS